MRLGTKIALSITGACLLATILEAALFTRSFARYSRESYFRTKLEEMRSVAKLIDGDYHRSISSQSAVGEPGYARIRAALGEILHADPFATYLYTVNLDTEGRPIYAVDAATVERDTLWLETDDIALEIGRGGSGELELRYDDVMRHPPFPVEPGDARLMIDESRIDGDARVTIAGAELLYWPADGSLPSVAGRTFPPGERTLEFRLGREAPSWRASPRTRPPARPPPTRAIPSSTLPPTSRRPRNGSSGPPRASTSSRRRASTAVCARSTPPSSTRRQSPPGSSCST